VIDARLPHYRMRYGTVTLASARGWSYSPLRPLPDWDSLKFQRASQGSASASDEVAFDRRECPRRKAEKLPKSMQ